MPRATATTTALALLALAAPGARAGLSVQIKNLCTFEIDLFDNSAVSPLAPGGDTSRTLSSGYVGMFRHGTSDQATLAEISLDAGSGRPWYDISTIPPGPGNCGSYQACKAATGKVGFNVAMQITPLTNVGSGTCTVLTCMNDGCSDAYLYPADDTKTHNCPAGTNFLVTFCPGGSGGATPAPTPSPTPSPTPTPTPTPSPTPEPTTPAPTTPEPTTTAPPTSEPPATNSSSSAKDENGPAAVNEEAVVGFASDLLASSKADSTTAAPATTTEAPVINTAPASGKDQGTVEANTQSSGGSGGGTGLVVAVVVGGVAMVAAAAIVAIRKKKMALEQLEQKTPMATPVRDRDNSLAAYQTTEVSVL